MKKDRQALYDQNLPTPDYENCDLQTLENNAQARRTYAMQCRRTGKLVSFPVRMRSHYYWCVIMYQHSMHKRMQTCRGAVKVQTVQPTAVVHQRPGDWTLITPTPNASRFWFVACAHCTIALRVAASFDCVPFPGGGTYAPLRCAWFAARPSTQALVDVRKPRSIVFKKHVQQTSKAFRKNRPAPHLSLAIVSS